MMYGIVPSHGLVTSCPCAVQHHAVEQSDTVAVPREWPAARCYTVVAEQSPVNTSC
jgi:hypothetical protein